MSDREKGPVRLRWAQTRLSIIGPLLADPPEHGDRARLEDLAARSWPHPTTGEAVRFGVSTLERWFHVAKSAENAVEALARKVPKHAGTQPSLGEPLRRAIELLYRQHPSWTPVLDFATMSIRPATTGPAARPRRSHVRRSAVILVRLPLLATGRSCESTARERGQRQRQR
jgi:hypothetical protein